MEHVLKLIFATALFYLPCEVYLTPPFGAITSPAAAQVPVSAGPVVTASSGDVSAATATATLPAPTAGYWQVTQLELSGVTATASTNVVCTVTGLLGGTMTFDVTVSVIPTAASAAASTPTTYVIPFSGGISGTLATAVVFSCPTFGSGNAHASINMHGFIIH